MPILITGLFAPSGGPGSFDLYAPEDIQAGDVNVVLQLVAGGAVKGGVHATAPVGEIVAQVRTTTGAPTHSASEGTFCWNSVDNVLYVNNDGGTGWAEIGAGGGHNVLDGSVHPDTLAGAAVLGDLIHGNATPKWERLPGWIGTQRYFLRQQGTGTASAVPTWGLIEDSDIPGVITRDAEHGDFTPAGHSPLIPKSIVDAKGDLIAATAADVVARLAVGANGYLLTADSAVAAGMKWAQVPGQEPAQFQLRLDDTGMDDTNYKATVPWASTTTAAVYKGLICYEAAAGVTNTFEVFEDFVLLGAITITGGLRIGNLSAWTVTLKNNKLYSVKHKTTGPGDTSGVRHVLVLVKQ